MEKKPVIRKVGKDSEKDGYEFTFEPEEVKEVFKEHLKEKKGEPIPESEVEADVNHYADGKTRVHVHRKRRK